MRILSVDDVGDSVAFIRGALTRHALDLRTAASVEDAEGLLRDVDFDFIIVDARLPEQRYGGLDYSAGARLLQRLRDGQLGTLNLNTGCMILTSYPDEILDQEISISNYKGHFSKNDMTPEILGQLVGVDLADSDEPGPTERPSRQTLSVNKPFDPTDQFIALAFATEDGDAGHYDMPINEAPSEVRFLYRHAGRPLYLYGTVHVADGESGKLFVNDIEIFPG